MGEKAIKGTKPTDIEIVQGETTEEEEEKLPMLFGKYLVLDRLTQGGMAKICLARYLGGAADDNVEAEKLVSLKMVLPEFSSNNDFKKMFLDEVKIIFALTHPNIVQTFDYGLIKDRLFISMEFIEGANLKQFLDKLKVQKKRFPIDASVYIIKTIAAALHYAHTYQDKLTGKKFNLIHRDISPDNIMITYDGNIKLIDFGIAKSDAKSEMTEAGTIKGKVSYLSPEYLTGDGDIDCRYDQFGVALVLWELLTNTQTFDGDSNMACLTKIVECKIDPPSKLNRHVDKDLDNIILKALSKSPEDRYDTMEDFSRALTTYLNKNFPEFHESKIKKYAQVLFKEEVKENHERFIEFGKIDPSTFVEEAAAEEGVNVTIKKNPETNVFVFDYDEEQEGDISVMEDGATRVLDLSLDFEEEHLNVVYEEDIEAEKNGMIVDQTTGETYRKTSGISSPATSKRLKKKKSTSTGIKNKKSKKSKKSKSSGFLKVIVFLVFGAVAAGAYLNLDKITGFIDGLSNGTTEAPVDLEKVKREKKKREDYLKQFELE